MEKVDVVVVGAGLAGLAAAYFLAADGFEVLVVERGDYPGSKNVSGGRIYLNPLRPLFPDLWDQAPLERPVTSERLTVMAPQASVTVSLASARFDQPPYHSYTVLRSRFDRWLADRVAERGALIAPKYLVDDLWMDGGRVVGVCAGGDRIGARVVVAADGCLSFLAERAGLRGRRRPEHFALAIKEVIELPAGVIEDRFQIGPGGGAAQLFFGTMTGGSSGGAFLYTNRDSLSLGLVLGLGSVARRPPADRAWELLEQFKQRPEIQRLVAGGQLAEYSAHSIPEGGLHAMPPLVGDGILLVGDAAGLALNLGLTVRGMDYAMASGALAARAIAAARRQGDYSAASLAAYRRLLRDSFIYQDLRTFRHVHRWLENPRLYQQYPQLVCELIESLFRVGPGPKQKLSATALQQLRPLARLSTLRDLLGLLRL